MNDSDESVVFAVSDASARAQQGANGASPYGALVSDDEAATHPGTGEMPEAEGAPGQLSLFSAPAQPPQQSAPLFHVRCPDCRAINDVPSLPTVCYVCRCSLGREERW